MLFEQENIYERSGHTRGSTVDLTLFDMNTEKDLDMGGTFDWFGPESHPDFCASVPCLSCSKYTKKQNLVRAFEKKVEVLEAVHHVNALSSVIYTLFFEGKYVDGFSWYYQINVLPLPS